jgi:hypothetical protein
MYNDDVYRTFGLKQELNPRNIGDLTHGRYATQLRT